MVGGGRLVVFAVGRGVAALSSLSAAASVCMGKVDLDFPYFYGPVGVMHPSQKVHVVLLHWGGSLLGR